MTAIKTNKTKILIFCISIFISIFCIFLMLNFQYKSLYKEYNSDFKEIVFEKNNKKVLDDIHTGTILTKEFKAKYNNFNNIYIKFNTINDDGLKLNIKLINIKDNKEIVNKTVSYYDFFDNSYILNFENQPKSKKTDYILIIKFEKVRESSVSIYYTDKSIVENDIVKVDDNVINGTFNINCLYKSKLNDILFYSLMFVIIAVSLTISFLIFYKKNINIYKVFLYTLPAICLMFVFIMPIFKSHDELRHWQRAYEISEFNFFSDIKDSKVQTSLPKAVSNPLNQYWRYIDYKDLKKSLCNSLDEDNRKYTDMSYTAVYSPVQYIPQSLGIIISRIFTDKVLVMAYSARIMNLIITLSLVFLSLKTIPYGKKIIFILASLPLSVEAFSSMSPDGITISVCFFFIAYVLKLYSEKTKKINYIDIIILLILAIIISLCKIVYVPLVLLIFIIPKEKFKSPKLKNITLTLILLISIIVNLIWLSKASVYLELSSAGSSSTQIMGILSNPFKYFQIILNTINVNGQRYFTSLFGGEIGWENFSLYSIVPYLFAGLFLFISITNDEFNNKLKIYQYIIIGIIPLTIFTLIFTSLYVQWTKPGLNIIDGVQGRYFIPFMPLISIIISKLNVKTKYKENNFLKGIGVVVVLVYIYILGSILVHHL